MDYYNPEVREQLALYIHTLSAFCLKGHNPYPHAKNMHLIFENTSRLRQMLEKWDVNDSYQIRKKLDWFFEEGHRAEFRDYRNLLSGLTESERSTYIQSLPEGDTRRGKLVVANHYMMRLPVEGISAYDFSWCIYVCCAGYELGYLTVEDKWRMAAICVRYARKSYADWKEYAVGYAAGADFANASSSFAYTNQNKDFLMKLLFAADSPLKKISLRQNKTLDYQI